MNETLCTDLYQMTMASGYFHKGMDRKIATCEMFVRKLPAHRRYLVTMGIAKALKYLENLHFTKEDIRYLETLPGLRDGMTKEFKNFLEDFRFEGDVHAMVEGTIAFAPEPIVRIRAPIIQAQFAETYLLSAINSETSWATKAARIVNEAGNAKCVEFGTRRVHPSAAIDAAYAACAAGFIGTSNVAAGREHGLLVMGTAAHMWTMAHDSEEESFKNYADVFSSGTVLLVDTYDTLKGTEKAISAAKDKLLGVRLDSGDILSLSKAVRGILDSHGLQHVEIVATGDLNEHKIRRLRQEGAPINTYGIGTDLVACADSPALGGVYKLVELDGKPKAKFSENKATLPGPHQVLRFFDGRKAEKDMIVTLDEGDDFPGAERLLQPVMVKGKSVYKLPLSSVQGNVKTCLSSLPEHLLDIDEGLPASPEYRVEISPKLQELLEKVKSEVFRSSM